MQNYNSVEHMCIQKLSRLTTGKPPGNDFEVIRANIYKSQSIRTCNLASAPRLCQWDLFLIIDRARIGTAECVWADVILLHIGKPIPLQGRDAFAHHWS